MSEGENMDDRSNNNNNNNQNNNNSNQGIEGGINTNKQNIVKFDALQLSAQLRLVTLGFSLIGSYRNTVVIVFDN